ncbi:hypothetical protein Taro_048403 [Colocasia esculenta]|uniref:Uncharacterized protein n=1 Tax=Colocasia esculenta TaxID=4460 RepID=A0A843X2T1_COLES|nr:hypothetical protein [Colocasia esculenta]
MRAACRTLGRHADVDLVKATPYSVTFRLWCWLVSTVLWLVVVERQLDLSSVTARLRGSSCVVLSRWWLVCVTLWLRCYPLWCALVVAQYWFWFRGGTSWR